MEAQGLVEDIKGDLDRLRVALKAAALPLEALESADDAAAEIEALASEPPATVDEIAPAREWDLHPGDAVRLVSLGLDGVVLELGKIEAEVQVGRLRIRAQKEDLIPASAAAEPAPARRSAPGPGDWSRPMRVAAAPPLELDLRGLTGDEALTELDRRLDSAYLAGLPFMRIIHGKGSGRLRDVVRQALRDSAYVRGFETGSPAEGGDGVTVVRLALDEPAR